MHAKLGWAAVFVVALTGGALLWWQREAGVRLDRTLGAAREQHHERERLRQENRRLAAEQPSSTQLDELRVDHAAISRLCEEIQAMRARIAAQEAAAQASHRFDAGNKVLASDWKNAGTGTPGATLETALWAAAGGDVDTFARCLLLNERVRQQATALLERLPAALREQYGTPEQLIAFLAITDVPVGAAQVTEWREFNTAPSLVAAQVQLSGPDGKTKDLNLRFANDAGGWRLLVPSYAIARYTTLLSSATKR